MFLPDETIEYTLDDLGVMGDREKIVNAGDLGRYFGPSPEPGWHYTEASKFPGFIVPVTVDMIRRPDKLAPGTLDPRD